MHNLKHNKVLHERVVIMSVNTENTPRVPPAKRFEIEQLSHDFTQVTLHFGYMESPRVPAALALLRKAGLKFDIMTTSFFLGRRTLKPAPNSGMPRWQDQLFIALSQAGGECDRLLLDPLRPRRRARRAGHDLRKSGRQPRPSFKMRWKGPRASRARERRLC